LEEEDEGALELSEDSQLSAAARSMAEKASSLGRFFAVVGMRRDDRARVLRAVREVAGVKASAEGTGRNRRIVFTPERPAPLARKTSAMAEEEEQEG